MLDIRTDTPATITEIRFADDELELGCACLLVKNHAEILITDDTLDQSILISDEHDALNLIRAIERAIDLGWWQ